MNLSTLREDIRDVSDDLLDAIEGMASMAFVSGSRYIDSSRIKRARTTGRRNR